MGLHSAESYRNGRWVKILCVLGAVIGIVEVILGMFGLTSGPYATGWSNIDPLIGAIVFGIISILICIIILASFRVIDVNIHLTPSWLVLLIFGIVIVLFGALYGGILVLIGALIATLDAL